jgi:hypothetical protein
MTTIALSSGVLDIVSNMLLILTSSYSVPLVSPKPGVSMNDNWYLQLKEVNSNS